MDSVPKGSSVRVRSLLSRGQRQTYKGRYSQQSQKRGCFYSSIFSFLPSIVLLINKQFGVNPLATKKNAILKL